MSVGRARKEDDIVDVCLMEGMREMRYRGVPETAVCRNVEACREH